MENLVSIIVPVYKVEKYLNRCILSIVNQTYSNIQIILVDDGSPDNCGKMCDIWKQKDDRIEVIHKKNGGLSDARNAGLRTAKGEYVLFVDSDDWISLNMVEKMLDEMIINNADMVMCQFIKVNQNGDMERLKSKLGKQIYTAKEAIKLLLDDKEVTNHVWRKLYKRSLIPNDVFPINKNYEDIYVMVELFHCCKKIVYLEEAYYYYLKNTSGIVSNISKKNIQDLYDSKMYSYSLIYKYYPELKKKINIKKKKIHKYIFKLRIINYIQNFSVYFWIRKITRFIKKINSKIKKIPNSIDVLKKINKSKSPRFYILGIPRHGNLGDQALTIGEDIFIKEHFPKYSIEHISLDNLNILTIIFLCLFISKKDYVCIHAGGNIGTFYPSIHKTQEKAIKFLRKYPIVIFPQTFYYSNDNFGAKMLNRTKKIYEKCTNLLVTLREKQSYNFVQKNFPTVKSSLVPDMVLNIPPFIKKFKRKGLLLCLRNDCERTISEKDYEILLNTIKLKFNNIEETDTHVYYPLSEEEAKEQLNILWTKMAKSEIVITDRLHGMIFSALTQTPCIVLLSKSHKLKGCYEWIKDLNYIILIENINELNQAMDILVNIKEKNYNNEKLKMQYKEFAKILKSWK